MKEYIFLYKSKFKNYCNVDKYPKSKLLDLNIFFSEDYSPSKIDIFTREISLYNITYVYNDFKNKMMYIGFGEWFIDEDIEGPSWDEYSNYVNETNSCKMSVDNFKEFVKKWLVLKQKLPPFAIVYRDDNDWVDCKGFDLKEEMELFVKNHQPKIIH